MSQGLDCCEICGRARPPKGISWMGSGYCLGHTQNTKEKEGVST